MDSHIEDAVTCDFAYKSESHVSQSELTPLSVDHTERVENEDKDIGEAKEEVNAQQVEPEAGSLQICAHKDTTVPGETSHSAKIVHAPPKPGSQISGCNWNILSCFHMMLKSSFFILAGKSIIVSSYSLYSSQFMELQCKN